MAVGERPWGWRVHNSRLTTRCKGPGNLPRKSRQSCLTLLEASRGRVDRPRKAHSQRRRFELAALGSNHIPGVEVWSVPPVLDVRGCEPSGLIMKHEARGAGRVYKAEGDPRALALLVHGR